MITSRLGINYYLRHLVIGQKNNFLGGPEIGKVLLLATATIFQASLVLSSPVGKVKMKVSLARITLVNEQDKYGRTTIAV